MLIGRDAERERIDRLVADARDGRSGALVLHGEAGIGKTALLQYARDVAADATVLSARGIETEAEIPYAGLWDFLGPVLDLRDRLPDAQATALGQALALGPGGTPPRFAVPAAVLGLLGAAAEAAPVVCLIDDVQWLDQPSVEAIIFASRRLGGDGVAVIMAVREDAGRRVDAAGIDELALGPLEPRAVAELLRREHGDKLSWSVAGELISASGGNPLAIVEVPLTLTPDELTGRKALPPVLPAGDSLEEAFRRRLAGLPPASREALVVAAAAAGSEDLTHLGAALWNVGLDARDLDAAEAAEVIELRTGRVTFRHPLFRSAAYHDGSSPQRRHAHRALADAAPEGSPARAWHLAAAAVTPNEEVARDLDEAAGDARRRGGHASAARAFARAAELSPESSERARRLLEAAVEAQEAGELDRANALAADGLESADDPLMTALLQRIQASVQIRLGRPEAGLHAMVDAADAVQDAAPGAAAAMLLEAGLARMAFGRVSDAVALGERALRLSEGEEVLEALADAVIGQALVASGYPGAGEDRFARRESAHLEMEPPPGAWDVLALAAHGSLWLQRDDRAERILARIVDGARAEGALARLAYPLAIRGQLAFRQGRWPAARGHADEDARAAADTGQDTMLAYALAVRAHVEAGLGAGDEARSLAADALRIARESEAKIFEPYTHCALGVLALAEGDAPVAVQAFERARDAAERMGFRLLGQDVQSTDLVEAYVRAGDRVAAVAELERLAPLEAVAQPPLVHAQMARARALLAEPESADEHFEEALAHHDRADVPFERARTELAYGERLRRRKARAEAREHLRVALDIFERLGARRWAERARAELRVGGGAAPGKELPLADILTPHELQVALIVARGATNKEVAASLFVSPKTVEHRLGQIYRKLEIRSRTELTRMLSGQLEAEQGAAAPAP